MPQEPINAVKPFVSRQVRALIQHPAAGRRPPGGVSSCVPATSTARTRSRCTRRSRVRPPGTDAGGSSIWGARTQQVLRSFLPRSREGVASHRQRRSTAAVLHAACSIPRLGYSPQHKPRARSQGPCTPAPRRGPPPPCHRQGMRQSLSIVRTAGPPTRRARQGMTGTPQRGTEPGARRLVEGRQLHGRPGAEFRAVFSRLFITVAAPKRYAMKILSQFSRIALAAGGM